MPACTIQPKDQKKQIQVVGNDLVMNYGKKKFYSVQEVKNANRRQGIDYDFCCWSHACFNSHSDFDEYHASIGETCDYVAMKREVLTSVGNSTDSSSLFNIDFDFDLSWLEFPNIEWSIFDFFD